MEGSFITTWINALIHPRQTFAAEKTKGSLITGIVFHLIGLVIAGLLSIAGNLIVTGASTAIILASLFGFIINIFTTFVMLFIIHGIMLGISKVLGGQGTLGQQFYLASLYYAPLAILGSILGLIIIFAPGALLPLGVLTLIIFLYELALTVLMLGEAHGYGLGKAFITVIATIALLVILVIILLLVIGFVFLAGLAAIFSSASQSGLVGLV